MRIFSPQLSCFVLGFAATALAQDAPSPAADRVEWSTDFQDALAKAKADGRPALVFFTASWCVPCKQLKEKVCSTPEFARAFIGHAFVMVDIDHDKAAARAAQVGPIPDVRFFAADGEELGGFVGERDLAGVLAAASVARTSALRAAEVRAALAKQPDDARTCLQLAELLLQRPNKQPGVDALARAVAVDADNRAGVAARAHWLKVGTCFHPIGRANDEGLADSKARLPLLEAWTAGDAPVYALAVRAWLEWSQVMRQWSERREREKDRDLRLAVPADAPLRRTLAELARVGAAAPAAADARADGLLVDGMLSYYSGDYPGGIERLTAFTSGFPTHRWHAEGLRFLAINQRLLRERDAKK